MLLFCLSKIRLKYIKDISMFNYKPAAVPLCICVFLCNDSLLNVSDDLSNVTGPRLSLEHKVEMERRGRLVIKNTNCRRQLLFISLSFIFFLILHLTWSPLLCFAHFCSISLCTSLWLDLGLLSVSVGVLGSECVAVMLSGDRRSA